MLSTESLNEIKKQASVTEKSRIVFIEIGNGFDYGSVTVGSANNQQVIQDLSTQLEWVFKKDGTQNINMMYRTGCEFKNGEAAKAIAGIIKRDLESNGFQVQTETKAYR